MRTTLDLVDILWSAIDGSDLKTEISGGIYKFQRPVNSDKEDVVINSLPLVNLDLQQAVCNVNIHVPNLTLTVNGAQDNSQPDVARLKTLAGMAIEILRDVYGEDYNYDVQQDITIRDQATGEWYQNIRINFFSININ